MGVNACLTGLGGGVEQYVYHLYVEHVFRNCTIGHLEMINILLSIRIFAKHWQGCRVLVKCNNEAVVTMLRTCKTKGAFLASCIRNILHVASLEDVDVKYVHVSRKKTISWQICCPGRRVNLPTGSFYIKYCQNIHDVMFLQYL